MLTSIPTKTNPLRGNSGYRITLLDQAVVMKESAGGDVERLRRQCRKQIDFRVSQPRFKVCKVLNQTDRDDYFSFQMPYCYADMATEFVDKAPPGRILQFANDLCDFIEELISQSKIECISASVIYDKSALTISSLPAACTQNDPGFKTSLERHLQDIQTHRAGFQIPIGPCHGDLTFANMLFDRDEDSYVLIDFLDPYIESPLLDIAKILQETMALWSSITTQATHDRIKYKLVMAVIHSTVLRRFGQQQYYRSYMPILEFQNLLRVLKYTEQPSIVSALKTRMNALIKERTSDETHFAGRG